MELTNRLNLPSTIVSAIQRDPYHQDGDISATGLIEPPRIRQLNSRYRGEITADVADRVWPLLGSNTHYILELADTKDGLQEERLSMTQGGWVVTGQADLYEHRIIYDYKITSVWAVLRGVKPEWEQQENIYAQLYREAGFSVEGLRVIAILRDWSKHQVKKSSNYPETQVVMLPVPLWPPDKAIEYIDERVHLHQVCEGLSDEDLPLCSPEERWERPTKYAIKKKGLKRASRVLDSMEEAEAWAEDNMKDKKFEIETRQGENVRCESYCDCNKFCSFYQGLKEESYGELQQTQATTKNSIAADRGRPSKREDRYLATMEI